MRAQFGFVIALLCVAACTPASEDGNPRNRAGDVDADATWGVVRQGDGLAAFLSRPGAAPDVVFWCRDNNEMIARVHVFQAPTNTPDLSLTTGSGGLVFTKVRRQGGVREGDRVLVEGFADLKDPKINAVIAGSDQVTLRSGTETYEAKGADVDKVMAGFIASCQALGPTSFEKTP
jgi:hypothetical protein